MKGFHPTLDIGPSVYIKFCKPPLFGIRFSPLTIWRIQNKLSLRILDWFKGVDWSAVVFRNAYSIYYIFRFRTALGNVLWERMFTVSYSTHGFNDSLRGALPRHRATCSLVEADTLAPHQHPRCSRSVDWRRPATVHRRDECLRPGTTTALGAPLVWHHCIEDLTAFQVRALHS